MMQPLAAIASRHALWLKLLAAVVVSVIAVAGYGSFVKPQPAPDVTFMDLQGRQVTMQQLRGKVVMVNFWATSCAICVKEMPRMSDTYRSYQARGLEFVAVAMQYDPPNYVLHFAQTRSLPFKVALDLDGDLARAFGDVQQTPMTFVIDKQGRIIKRYLGEPDWEGLHKLLDQALT